MQPSQQYDSISMLLSTLDGRGVDPSDVPVGPMYIYSHTKLLAFRDNDPKLMYDSSSMPVRALLAGFEGHSPVDNTCLAENKNRAYTVRGRVKLSG